ncbi:hypothetical protein MXD61_10605 [Frankia sp. AgPm24]|nr:hypothetical protein [Frankia sp. AgPm24]MCK9922319.1 hypothetical protein [Frankia sp. AgPm24]
MDSRVLFESRHDAWRRASGEIVENDVDFFVRVGFHGFLDEVQEVVSRTGGAAFADDLACADVKYCEQVGGAVSDVVVGSLLGGVEGDR